MGNASHAPRIMVAFLAASRVLAISVNKCDHVSERKLISTFSYDLRMQDVYELYHPPIVLNDTCVLLIRRSEISRWK